MKKFGFRIIVLWLVASQLSFAQDNSKNTDNYTIQRLIIKNNKDEILIYKGKIDWMTPALRHNKNKSIKEGLRDLAGEYGLEITSPILAGLFTYKFDFKNLVSFRSFYTAKVIGSDAITSVPSPIKKTKWVSREKILSEIGGLQSRKKMLKQILENPETLWGGSFYLYDDKKGVRHSRVLEEFYPLR